MYLYDMHVHTANASKCARSYGSEMAGAYAKKGYTGIIITDHFFNGYTCIPDTLPWQERVHQFCSGYYEAKDVGEKENLQVFFGWEYCLDGTEFLTYGLSPEWLESHEDVDKLPIIDYFDLVHKDGGFISHAHPFRKRADIPPVKLFPSYMDAVEVFNGGNASDSFNDEAKAYAINNGLLFTAGSDTHSINNMKPGAVAFVQRPNTLDDLIQFIRNGDGETITKQY